MQSKHRSNRDVMLGIGTQRNTLSRRNWVNFPERRDRTRSATKRWNKCTWCVPQCVLLVGLPHAESVGGTINFCFVYHTTPQNSALPFRVVFCVEQLNSIRQCIFFSHYAYPLLSHCWKIMLYIWTFYARNTRPAHLSSWFIPFCDPRLSYNISLKNVDRSNIRRKWKQRLGFLPLRTWQITKTPSYWKHSVDVDQKRKDLLIFIATCWLSSLENVTDSQPGFCLCCVPCMLM